MHKLDYLENRHPDIAANRKERKWYREHGASRDLWRIDHAYPAYQNGVYVTIKKLIGAQQDKVLRLLQGHE